MSFAFVPMYIRLLGIEAYGLIGFFASMMAVFALLDLGLGLTVNRELARATAQRDALAGARDLLRTLEAAYWTIGVLIGATIIVAAPFIVDHWLNIRSLDHDAVVTGVRAMGVTALMRWPVSLYFGALTGMQRQVQLNIVTSISATVASAGVVAILAILSRTVTAFFLWQALIAGVQVAILRGLAWRSITLPAHRPCVTFASVRASMGFSVAVTGITLLSIILTQLDKFVLSRMLPLDVFGRYALCGAIAGVLTTVGTAVEGAAFPALSRIVAAGDVDAERRLYHQASQGLALLIVPGATTLVIFSRELLTAYIGDPVIVDATYRLLSLMAAGSGILALMFMPLSLQLAHGWTKLSLIKNIAAVSIFTPVLFILVGKFGALGAGISWLSLMIGYLIIEVPIMHSRLLVGEKWKWYCQDIGIPLCVSVVFLAGLRLIIPDDWSLLTKILSISATCMLSLITAIALLPTFRTIVRDKVVGRVLN